MTDPTGNVYTVAEPTDCPFGECGHMAVLVPEGKFALTLKMRELDQASRKLGTDVLDIFTADPKSDKAPSPLGYAALVQLAHQWARRQDPKAKLEPLGELEFDELSHLLGKHRAVVQEGDEAEDPSQPDESSEPA